MKSRRGECILVSLALMGCMLVIVALLGVAGYAYYRKMSQPQVRPMPHQTPTRQVTLSRESEPGRPSSVRVIRPPTPGPAVETPVPSPSETSSYQPTSESTSPAPTTKWSPSMPTPSSPSPIPQLVENPDIRADGMKLGMSFSEVQRSWGKLTKAAKPAKNPWNAVEYLPPGSGPRLFFGDGRLVAADQVQEIEFHGQTVRRGDPADLTLLRSLFVTRLETQKTEIEGGVRHNFPMASLEVQVWVDRGHCRQLTLARRPGRKASH